MSPFLKPSLIRLKSRERLSDHHKLSIWWSWWWWCGVWPILWQLPLCTVL